IWLAVPASNGPDEIRIYTITGKTTMFVARMSTTLPIATPFREIRFIIPAPLPIDASTTQAARRVRIVPEAASEAEGFTGWCPRLGLGQNRGDWGTAGSRVTLGGAGPPRKPRKRHDAPPPTFPAPRRHHCRSACRAARRAGAVIPDTIGAHDRSVRAGRP